MIAQMKRSTALAATSIFCILSLALCTGLPTSTSTTASTLATQIQSRVNPTLIDNGPGVAVLVIDNGEIVHRSGYGFADIDAETLIDANSVFDLASVSKQFTALAIQILAERGELTINDTLASHVVEFVEPDPSRPITLKDLLHHVSGLDDYSGDSWEGTDDEFSNLTVQEHLAWINDHDLLRTPGTVYEYNNSGYVLLAHVVESVAGKTLPQFLQDEVFDPLDMDSSIVMNDADQTILNRVTGYIVEDDEVSEESNPTAVYGDGNVFTNLNDLAKYDAALRNHSIINSQSINALFEAARLDNGNEIEDDGLGYGMGWELGDGYVSHSGNWDGTSTYYLHFTEREDTVIVLSNDSNYDGETLAHAIAELIVD